MSDGPAEWAGDPHAGQSAEPHLFSAGRERALIRAFADLSEALGGDFDVHELLDRLGKQCLSLLDVTACGVLLIEPAGGLSLVAAVPAEDRVLETFRLQSDEGPCVDSVRTGQPVRSDDLAGEPNRWPTWTPVALANGFHTVYATPLRTVIA